MTISATARRLSARNSATVAVAALALSWFALSAFADGEFDRGVMLYKKADYRGALAMFSRSLQDGNNATVMYYAALCYQQLGDVAHARSCFKLVCDNFAASPEAKLAAQGLKLLEEVPDRPPAAAKTPSAAKPEKDPRQMPGAMASPQEVHEFLSNYELSDQEWEHLPEQTKIPFQRATSSHPFVNVTVNGRPMRMMFDTGASICMFDRRSLDSAGVKIDRNGPHTRIGGVAGSTDAQVMVADIELGDFKRSVPVVVSESPLGVSLLGQTFFKDFKYDVDNGGGFIKLTKKPRPGMKFHVYESTDVVKIPYQPAGNNMMVQVKINGHPTGMYFDTGAQSITLSILTAAALGIQIPSDAQRVAAGGVGGQITGVKVYVDRIELGPLIKTNVPVTILMGATPPLLGQPFFAGRNFTIDNENRTINFAH